MGLPAGNTYSSPGHRQHVLGHASVRKLWMFATPGGRENRAGRSKLGRVLGSGGGTLRKITPEKGATVALCIGL